SESCEPRVSSAVRASRSRPLLPELSHSPASRCCFAVSGTSSSQEARSRRSIRPGDWWCAASPRSLLSALDLDLARGGLLRLGQVALHHPVLVARADLLGLDGCGHRDRPRERAVAPLSVARLALALGLLLLALAADGEGVAVKADLEVLVRHAWHVE